MNPNQFVINCARLQRALLAQGLDTRAKIVAAFDGHGRGSEGTLGIGRTLALLLKHLLNPEVYGRIEWQAALPGIKWEGDTGSGEPGYSE